ncbi:MucR family transcriptional regulator [Methylobacterium variabile]|uniref:MucR family transcriptional regulator n=1 Tax=Methylobacterium variabile TaxID=298794 RepID=UPI00069EC4B2|nr:MucR family transcriptional regulator [Methylobacterium variabile]
MNRPHRTNHDTIVECTARIVMAYVAGNRIPPDRVAPLIESVFEVVKSPRDFEVDTAVPEAPALTYVASDHPRPQAPARLLTRREIEDSVQETYLVCFEDNKHYRMLARHLRLFGLTPDAYREKWGLPDDYPMMPAADHKHRSELARQRNLWQYDRSAAKPRKKYVMKAKKQPQGVEDLSKPKAYSMDLTRGRWSLKGEIAQAATPG